MQLHKTSMKKCLSENNRNTPLKITMCSNLLCITYTYLQDENKSFMKETQNISFLFKICDLKTTQNETSFKSLNV